MANKELKSIKFEGLDDTYVIPNGFKVETVDALPTTGEEGVIYLISSLKASPLYRNPLATIQATTSASKTFIVDKTTNIKAGMTLKLVNDGAMGEVTVASVTASTKTVTLTNAVTVTKGTLIFDNSQYGKDTHAEYIWNTTTNKFEILGLIDLNVQSKAIAQSVVGRDWNGRAQIATPSADADIANKLYVDEKVGEKQDTLVSGTNIKTINGESVLGEGNITVTPSIDSALSDTSENAVQNKIVKAAIDGKLDKITTTAIRPRLYNIGTDGTQGTISYTDGSAASYTIAQRQSNGALKVGEPVANNDAATKKYVDNAVANNVYEANLRWGGKNFAGTYGILDAALIPTLGADRFRAISNANAISVEYSRDGGVTWIDYEASDTAKKLLFADDNANLTVGKATTAAEVTANYKVRVIIDAFAASIYSQINKIAIRVSTNGSKNCSVTIDSTPSDGSTEDNYTTVHAQDIPISGWDGWNIINVSGFILRSNSNMTTQSRKLRFTFSIGSHNDASYTGLQVLNIKAFGGIGWSTPSFEGKYGSPFRYINDAYTADRAFNFTSTVKANGKPLATQEYVQSKITSSRTTVVDNLTSTSTTSALSANQGKTLNDKLDLKYDLASGLGLNDYNVSIVNETGDLMSDMYAGDISVTQVNGSSGLSGGIKINNSVPTLYSGSKSATIESVIDGVGKVANKYDKVSNVSINTTGIATTQDVGGLFTTGAKITNQDIESTYTTDGITYEAGISANQGKPAIIAAITNKAPVYVPIYNLDAINNSYDIVYSYNPSWASNNGAYYCQVNYAIPLNADSAIRTATLKLPNPLTGTTETGTFKFKYTPDAEGANASLDYYVFTNGWALLVCNPTNTPIPDSGSGVIPWTRYTDGLYDGIVLIYNSNWASATTITNFNPIGTLGNTAIGVKGSGTITFDEPLVLPKKYDKTQRIAIYGDPTNYYTYIEHPDGTKECEIQACVNSVQINSAWGTALYDGSLGSFSFKSGFFSNTPTIDVEILNAQNSEHNGGVALMMEKGFYPTTTSTGNLCVARPSTLTTDYVTFKIHARQV